MELIRASWDTLGELLGVSSPRDHVADFNSLMGVAKGLPVSGSYWWIGSLASEFVRCEEIHGAAVAELYARQLLLESLDQSSWQPNCRVPCSVAEELEMERERIHQEVLKQPAGHYLPFSDGFYKDFSLLRGKSLPVYTGIVDIDSVLWRKPLKTGTIAQRLLFITLLFRRPIGHKFFLQYHVHTSLLGNFNPEGWVKTYKLVADILKENDYMKGFCVSSWFYDPQLESVSPRLSYLACEPLAHGAYRFYLGLDHSGSALATSKTRNRLYKQGDYLPRGYMLVWHRKEMINWQAFA